MRIFPIYYLSILVVGVLITWEYMGYVAIYLSNYFFSYNHDPNPMRHTWSLCVEEHFYLFWPLIIRFCSRETARRMITLGIPVFVLVGTTITFSFAEPQLAKDLIYRGTNYRILTLALGSSLAYYEPYLRGMTSKRVWALVAGLLACILFMRTYYKIEALEQLPQAMLQLIILSLVSVGSVALIVRLNYASGKLRSLQRLFANPPILFVGKISYGVYLYHFPILFFLGITEEQNPQPIAAGTGFFALFMCFLVPTVSWYAIERPLSKLKDRLSAR